jgi:hypothetical protein
MPTFDKYMRRPFDSRHMPNGDKRLITFEDEICIAYALYDAGFVPYWSHDYADNLICGFGDSPSGFRYELVVADPQDISKGILPWDQVKGKLEIYR